VHQGFIQDVNENSIIGSELLAKLLIIEVIKL